MATSISTTDQRPQKWALLIGINKYPKLHPDKQLKGCVNDVNAIEKLLTSRVAS